MQNRSREKQSNRVRAGNSGGKERKSGKYRERGGKVSKREKVDEETERMYNGRRAREKEIGNERNSEGGGRERGREEVKKEKESDDEITWRFAAERL